MINFFRKIRQKSVNEKRPNVYLVYAIGEIFLVVVGILIALSIDNWNEERKQAVLEIQFLKRLKNDLISDTVYFKRRIKLAEKIIENHYQYIHKAYEEQKDIKEYKELLNLLIWDSEHFTTQNSTFLELLNAGQLNIFKNKDLKEGLISLYKDYDIASKHIKEYNEFSAAKLRTIAENFIKYWGPLSYIFDKPYMFNEIDWRYTNDPGTQEFKQLEVTAAIYADKHKRFLYYFNDFQNKVKLMIIDIERELENRN